MIQILEDVFYGPKITVLILWNRQTIEAQFHRDQSIFEQIAKKLQLNFPNDKIVIITQDLKLLSQKEEFSIISNNEQQVFAVFQISSIFELNNQIGSLIEQLNKKDQEIAKLKEENISLNSQIEALQQTIEQMQGKTASSFVQKTFQNQNLCESSISFDLTTSQHYYIDALQKQKNDELAQLQRIGSQIQSSIYKSVAQTLKVNCSFCNQDFEQDLIQLNCQHFYHEQCFESLLEAQLVLNEPQFNCLCKMKIKQSELKALSNQQKLQIFQLQMNLKQLSVIKENIQDIRKCERKFCSFFYIYDEKQKQTGKYCPLCLQ